jgi:hypothetical protein
MQRITGIWWNDYLRKMVLAWICSANLRHVVNFRKYNYYSVNSLIRRKKEKRKKTLTWNRGTRYFLVKSISDVFLSIVHRRNTNCNTCVYIFLHFHFVSRFTFSFFLFSFFFCLHSDIINTSFKPFDLTVPRSKMRTKTVSVLNNIKVDCPPLANCQNKYWKKP